MAQEKTKILKNTDPPDLSAYREHNCFYNSAIIWDQYGYWTECCPLPAWCTEEYIAEAKEYAQSLKPYRIVLWYTNHSTGGSWKIYDAANKVIYWENSVTGCKSAAGSEAYIRRHGLDYVCLFSGVLDALLTYKNTGQACLPDWNTNASDSYGYKDGKKSLVPRVSEIRGE